MIDILCRIHRTDSRQTSGRAFNTTDTGKGPPVVLSRAERRRILNAAAERNDIEAIVRVQMAGGYRMNAVMPTFEPALNHLGEPVLDKSPHSHKEVTSYRYSPDGVEQIRVALVDGGYIEETT